MDNTPQIETVTLQPIVEKTKTKTRRRKPAGQTPTARIRAYIEKHPNATSDEIARALRLSARGRNIMYVLRTKLKKTAAKPVLEATPSKSVQPSDPVNSPAHYTYGGVETIQFIEAKQLNYNLGNAVKYISRAKHKSNYVQDLKKAVWYLEREIELHSA